MTPLYISGQQIYYWLSRVIVVLVLAIFERTWGLPVLTLFFLLVIAQSMSPLSRILWLLILGLFIATIYVVPFWLMIAVVFISQFSLEVLSFSWLKKQMVMGGLSILGNCLLLIFTTMTFSKSNLLQFSLVLILVGIGQGFQGRVNRNLGRSSWLQWYEKHRD